MPSVAVEDRDVVDPFQIPFKVNYCTKETAISYLSGR
jgi:hypothetical protein